MSHLSPSLYGQLKTAILADPTLSAYPNDTDGANAMLPLLNALASPAFYVWRSAISAAEIYDQTSPEATVWDWTSYKSQAVTEQGAWEQMFHSGRSVNMSLLNLRTGVEKIFGVANAQTVHVKAMGKRQATRAEKIFASVAGGTGLQVAPASLYSGSILIFEGLLDYIDVDNARHS